MNHTSSATRRRRDPVSLLSAGLGARLGMAAGALVVLWLTVFWALS